MTLFSADSDDDKCYVFIKLVNSILLSFFQRFEFSFESFRIAVQFISCLFKFIYTVFNLVDLKEQGFETSVCNVDIQFWVKEILFIYYVSISYCTYTYHWVHEDSFQHLRKFVSCLNTLLRSLCWGFQGVCNLPMFYKLFDIGNYFILVFY